MTYNIEKIVNGRLYKFRVQTYRSNYHGIDTYNYRLTENCKETGYKATMRKQDFKCNWLTNEDALSNGIWDLLDIFKTNNIN